MQPGQILLSCAVLVALAVPACAAPDEDVLGKAAGYPIGKPANWFFDESVRVGSFSRLDSFLPHYTLRKSAFAAAASQGRERTEARPIASRSKPSRSTISWRISASPVSW